MVIRRNPGHPAEERESLEQVIWKPEVDEHCAKGPQEELVATHAVKPLEWPRHGDIVVIVERRVQRDGHQRVRPDAV